MTIFVTHSRADRNAPRDANTAPYIIGLGGTTRPHSTSERALRIALAAAAADGAVTRLLCAADLRLPMYTPDAGDRTPPARRLVGELARCDGLIISSPGYHGGLSGLIKNALDYAEDLRNAEQPYLEGRAVGCIVSAAGWQATTTTLISLRSVVHALRGWPTPLGVAINSTEGLNGGDGHIKRQLHILSQQVVEFARRARPT